MADRREWTRREFVRAAAGIGAALAWAPRGASLAPLSRTERRDLYPEGVASGDPYPDSVVLWTRRPPVAGSPRARRLTVEIGRPAGLRAHRRARRRAGRPGRRLDLPHPRRRARSRRRVLVPLHRRNGLGSRVGRTLTAPGRRRPARRRLRLRICQDVTQGAQNAYRRMIYEDERARADGPSRLRAASGRLHLRAGLVSRGPSKGMYDRRLRDVVRYPHGQPIRDFHIPTDVDDYRLLYQGYLHDPDLQDARARWPFVCMWDNHEFSGEGGRACRTSARATARPRRGRSRPTRRGSSTSRRGWPSRRPLLEFGPPGVEGRADRAVRRQWARPGAEQSRRDRQPHAYRALRTAGTWTCIITDQHSYRSKDPSDRPEAGKLGGDDFPDMFPRKRWRSRRRARVQRRHPPAKCASGRPEVQELREEVAAPDDSRRGAKGLVLGAPARSTATWKVWGNSMGTLDSAPIRRTSPPGSPRPGRAGATPASAAATTAPPMSNAGEIYDLVRDPRITGFAIVPAIGTASGRAMRRRPCRRSFEPVGLAFVGASVPSPGAIESNEHRLAKDHPLRPLFLADRPDGAKPERTSTCS